MKLGYYYHTEIYNDNGKLYINGYQGVFLDSLAQCVDELVLFMHEAPNNSKLPDYQLVSNNIRWINLGKKQAAWKRFFFSWTLLGKFREEIKSVDAMLVRSPSPLSVGFSYFVNRKKLFYFLVGDYLHGANNMKISGFRDFFVKLLVKKIDKALTSVIENRVIFVNSNMLKSKYSTVAVKIIEVRTTTLQAYDMKKRDDTCKGELIHLLYTGRFDFSKGLLELVHAFKILYTVRPNLRLHFVGWEDNPNKPVLNALFEKVKEYSLDEFVQFHGRKKIGAELNRMYFNSDIYIIPSFHEGFPRTIWEAMGQSTPVIATKVGGIPFLLDDKENSLLIEPKIVNEIVDAVESLISDEFLRRKIIINGYEKAKTVTLQNQSKLLISQIKNEINEY